MQQEWLRQVYDDYHTWKGWNARTSDADAARSVKDLKLADVAPPARLLEIGYGDGAFLLRAHRLGFDCHGVELTDERIDDLSANGLDVRVGSIGQFKNLKFDLIVAFDVFEHVEVPEILNMLQLISQQLAVNGRLLVRFPNMASPFGLVNQYGDITHVTSLSPTSFLQLAHIADLSLVKFRNASVTFGGSGVVRSMIKPISYFMRSILEAALGLAYYGGIIPLSPNVVVVLKKDSPIAELD